MSRVVLAALGSLGSVHPYLAVAAGLKLRGHTVVVAGAESHRAKIEAEEFIFHPVRPDHQAVIARREADKRGSEVAVKTMLQSAEETYADLLAVCRDADLFISHPGAFTGPLVAEKLRLRWLSVALAPATLFSVSDPPVIPSMPWIGAFGRWPHSLLFRVFKRLTRGWMKPIHELRRRVGLPPTKRHPFFEDMFSPWGTLCWFSSLLAAPRRDWPASCRVTGFPFFRSPRERSTMSPELAEFLASGDPPVVFTLGSNVIRDAGDFYDVSLQAAEQAGCRAVLLVGDPRNIPSRPLPRNAFAARYVSHAELFPRAAAMVHHGGITTLAEGMIAGNAMLIVPFTHDQPDNAARAARLGIARVESRKRYTAARAAEHIRALLGQPEYAGRAKEVQASLRLESGVEQACAAIETVI